MQDFRSYHSICRDIVNRWVYPLVPDAQLVPGSNFVHTKRYTYRESGVQVSRSAVVGEGVVLSRGTVVGDKSVLRRTNVGRDCHVGHNCSVTDSHLFESKFGLNKLYCQFIFGAFHFLQKFFFPCVTLIPIATVSWYRCGAGQ